MAGISGSNPAWGMEVSLASVLCVCCRVEVSATDRSLVQKSSTECGVPECELESSTRMASPTRATEP